jgi:hypothetical protein
MSTPAPLRWNHYRARLNSAELIVDMENPAELVRFALDNHVRSVLVLLTDEKVSHFAISHKGGIMRCEALGYADLTDVRDSLDQGFADAKEYYDARQRGYRLRADYLNAVANDVSEPATLEAMRKQGYLSGFEDFERLRQSTPLPEGFAEVTNANQLYQAGQKGRFESWFELYAALEKGFSDATTYRASNSLGYASAKDYEAGRKGHFHNAEEWTAAVKAQCTDRKDYLRYLKFELMRSLKLAHDACLLVEMLSKLPEQRDVPLDKIHELLQKELNNYRNGPDGRPPRWFTTQMDGKTGLVNVLRTNDHIKRFGTFNNAKSVFRTLPLQERHVVLDGSNVAHNSQGDGVSIPTVRNIELMIEELKSRGFNKIKVIIDAALLFRLSDVERLDALRESVDYMESPPGTSADFFIIKYVQTHHCLLITNDMFRDWKKLEPWIEDNIDFYRIRFRIEGDKVLLPGLKH